jgi:hypothetical protein
MAQNVGYKWFIDEFVKLAKGDVSARRIRENGHHVRVNDSAEFPLSDHEIREKDFLLALGSSGREIIAQLLERARCAAVHDVACMMEGQILEKEVSLIVRGETFSESAYVSYHYDFISRLEGDSWPDEK